MNTLFDKIWNDLWSHKGRTAQVVLIIAMGAFAIGMIIGTRNLMIAGMENLWQQASPAIITLWANPNVDNDVLRTMEHIPGVAQVEGFARASVEWRLTPNERWRPAGLIARDDYENQKYVKLGLLNGNWPRQRTVATSQGSDVVYGIRPGQPVYWRLNDREYVVQVGGLVYDPVIQPPSFGGNAKFLCDVRLPDRPDRPARVQSHSGRHDAIRPSASSSHR